MIRVDHLKKTYDKHAKNASPALYDVSFTLPDTGFVCIVGPSGCGKTTLLNSMGGLDVFDGGKISTDSLEDCRCGSAKTEAERNRSFGYIFQNYYLLPDYSAAYNVYLGLHALDLSHEEKLKRSLEALRAVDMERFARRQVGQLSGGQQQRVAIARTLARRPRVIFADEPTGNLDEANTMNICALLRKISRNSLVVMVTHEERIARFFADRIITLSAGHLMDDSEAWSRDAMDVGGGTLYTGDFQESTVGEEGLTLRLLREEDAPPVEITLLARKDSIIIKLNDSRVVTTTRPEESPKLVEGSRPVLKLEHVEQETIGLSWDAPAKAGKAGGGIGLPMLGREAHRLARGKGIRRITTWIFLTLLAVLTLYTVADYMFLSTIDPREFIITDSHILEISTERDSGTNSDHLGLKGEVAELLERLHTLEEETGKKIELVPVMGNPYYQVEMFYQMSSVTQDLMGFSYVPISYFDESTLIMGRTPQRPDEVVIDRWVLDNMIRKEGIIQNSITDVSYFLGRQLQYRRKNFAPTIVGISDCGEPAMFVYPEVFVTLGTSGNEVVTLSSLRAMYPGKYDALDLSGEAEYRGESHPACIIFTNRAGDSYKGGGVYNTAVQQKYASVLATEEPELYAILAIADEALRPQLEQMICTSASSFHLYCEDKEVVKDYLRNVQPEAMGHTLKVSVRDTNADSWSEYYRASGMRLGARQVVTFTVIALCMVMLYLLQRTRVQERIGMIAVYRLLGIPGGKLRTVFALESAVLSLTSLLPAAVLAWV
ncbi:MAG: ABC transporter ATP-binding protein, partial [Oscillospiraceae bacterium]|nr:ABC transporter ATP-binding protein [Oscillospiraceae bacterium]